MITALLANADISTCSVLVMLLLLVVLFVCKTPCKIVCGTQTVSQKPTFVQRVHKDFKIHTFEIPGQFSVNSSHYHHLSLRNLRLFPYRSVDVMANGVMRGDVMVTPARPIYQKITDCSANGNGGSCVPGIWPLYYYLFGRSLY